VEKGIDGWRARRKKKGEGVYERKERLGGGKHVKKIRMRASIQGGDSNNAVIGVAIACRFLRINLFSETS